MGRIILNNEEYTGSSGSAPVTDVTVNGSSVVNAQGVAEVTAVQDNPTFTEASTRANIASGESFATILGKIKKFFTDLKSVAFSGAYSDLSGTPTKLSDFTDDVGYLESSDITVTQVQSTGTKIATIDVDGTSTDLYAPAGGGGSVNDVTVNGTSVVNAQGVAEVITSDRVAKSGDTMSGNLNVEVSGGESSVSLGNATTGNTGALYVYANATKYNKIVSSASGGYRTNTLPNKDGTFAMLDDIPDISTKVSKSGDTMSGCLTVAGGDNFAEGVRCNTANDGYFTLLLGGTGTSGTRDGAFWIGGNNTLNPRVLFVTHNGSTAGTTYFHASSSSDQSPKLHLPSGNIASDDYDAVNGVTVYSYIASGNKDRDVHDCNSIAKNGVFYYTANGPDTSLGASTTDGALYVQAYSSSWVAQIAQDYRNGRLFVRGKNNNVWQPWKRLLDSTGGTITGDLAVQGTLTAYNFMNLYSDTWLKQVTLNLPSTLSANRIISFPNKDGTIALTSDISSRRYKENIVPLSDDEAKKILDVEIVNYDYKENVVDEDERYDQKGAIAEDVVNLIPNAVTYADIDGEQLPDGINYTKFIPYLIKMVQIQQKEIEELKAMIKGE